MKTLGKCLVVFVVCAVVMGAVASLGRGDFQRQTTGAFIGLVAIAISALVGGAICGLIAERLSSSSGTVAGAFGVGVFLVGPLLFPGPLVFYLLNHALKH